MKIAKPSSTRWLSHERCTKAINPQRASSTDYDPSTLYETSDDAEAYEVQSSFSGVAAIVLLHEIQNLLATLNCFMQRKTAGLNESILEQIRYSIVLSGVL